MQAIDGRDVMTWLPLRDTSFSGPNRDAYLPIRRRSDRARTLARKPAVWALVTDPLRAVEGDPAGGQIAEIAEAANDADVETRRTWTPPTS
jgi:hypothetical protein